MSMSARLFSLALVSFLFPAAIGAKAGWSAYATARDWVEVRHYVPIEATVQDAYLSPYGFKPWGGRRDYRFYELEASFAYRYGPHDYQSDAVTLPSRWRSESGDRAMFDILDSHRVRRAPVTLWVNPAHPERALFNKDANLFSAALLASVAVFFLGMLWPIGAALMRGGSAPLPTAGGRITIEPGVNLSMFGVTVAAWNVFAWLTAGVGGLHAVLLQQPLYWLLLGLPLSGLWMVRHWWRWRSHEWHRGKPLLALRVARSAGVTHLYGAMHFDPGLGMGKGAPPGPHYVTMNLRKMGEEQVGGRPRLRMDTLRELFSGDVERGTAMIDFSVDLPAAEYDPALDQLDVTLVAVGAAAIFTLPRSAP